MTHDLLGTGPATAPCRIVLAHGAGAPMTSAFMDKVSVLLAGHGIAVTRFEFGYMAARRRGARKPPPRADRLTAEYEAIVDRLAQRSARNQRLVIGGKSMGGRVASMVADDLYSRGLVSGLVCLGYPFHPPAKPDSLRTGHLATLKCPALIVQGERDPFGTRAEVEAYGLSSAIGFHWAADGDHDLKPRRPGTQDGNLAAAAAAIASFCAACFRDVTPSDDAPAPRARAPRT